MTGWWCNNHLEKYEFVNGVGIIPYITWNICFFETTNQMINHPAMGVPWPEDPWPHHGAQYIVGLRTAQGPGHLILVDDRKSRDLARQVGGI